MTPFFLFLWKIDFTQEALKEKKEGEKDPGMPGVGCQDKGW